MSICCRLSFSLKTPYCSFQQLQQFNDNSKNMSTEESQFNVQGYNIITILKRLEAATSRLEDITIFQEEANKNHYGVDSLTEKGTPKSRTVESSEATSDGKSLESTSFATFSEAPVEKSKLIVEFENFVESYVHPLVETSKKIDSLVGESAQYFYEAFVEQGKFLELVLQSQQPDMTDPALAKALEPMNAKCTKINELKDSNRKSPFFNHLNTFSESNAVFYWIGIPTPVSYITDTKDTVKFWSDRVLKEYKTKDQVHVEWVKQTLSVFDELKNYVNEYHTTGVAWNPKGKPFAEVVSQQTESAAKNSSSASGSAGGAAPPPPPPPPPATFFDDTEKDSGNPSPASGGINAVFAELNQGANITSGLKKVDKSEMTHKNPELRKQPPVAPKKPAPPKKPSSLSGGVSSAPVKKPAKKELIDGTKWIIQNFTKADISDLSPITIEVEMHQSVFIGNCSDVTIQLKGKANAVSVSETKNVALVIDSLISGVDVIKSYKFGIQVLGLVPMLSIDKSDEGTIYLSQESIDNDSQVFTSSTTALNINAPKENDDYEELAVPEQFVSKVVNGKLVTQIVEHAG